MSVSRVGEDESGAQPDRNESGPRAAPAAPGDADSALPGVLIRLPAVAQKAVRRLPVMVIGRSRALAGTGARMGGAVREIWLSQRSAAKAKSLAGLYRAFLMLLHSLVFDRPIERLFFRPTRDWIRLSGLRIPAAARARGRDCFPTPRLSFEWAISGIPGPLERFAFIDYGAGRGRVLLMACAWPFEKAVGVEFSEELAEDCRMNIAQFPRSRMRCRDVECATADMMDFAPPAQDAVHYFLDPIEPGAFLEVARRIAAESKAGGHTAWLVCLGMDCDAEIVHLGFQPVALPLATRIKAALFSPYRIALFRMSPG